MHESGSSDEAALWRWVADYATLYRSSLKDRAVAPRVDSQSIAAGLGELETLPAHGATPFETIAELVRLAEPGITAMSGHDLRAGWLGAPCQPRSPLTG